MNTEQCKEAMRLGTRCVHQHTWGSGQLVGVIKRVSSVTSNCRFLITDIVGKSPYKPGDVLHLAPHELSVHSEAPPPAETQVATNIKPGHYVQVTRKLDPWESSGESEDDLSAYIGHVGIVVEVDAGEEWTYVGAMVLVRFPDFCYERAGQRNIEASALTLISQPPKSIPPVCFGDEDDGDDIEPVDDPNTNV